MNEIIHDRRGYDRSAWHRACLKTAPADSDMDRKGERAMGLNDPDGVFRSVHFPEKIDPDSAAAEHRDGMWRITANVAKPVAQKKVEVVAA